VFSLQVFPVRWAGRLRGISTPRPVRAGAGGVCDAPAPAGPLCVLSAGVRGEKRSAEFSGARFPSRQLAKSNESSSRRSRSRSEAAGGGEFLLPSAARWEAGLCVACTNHAASPSSGQERLAAGPKSCWTHTV